MKEYLTDLVRDKKVLVFGFLKEGQSTYKLLRELDICERIDITDSSFDKDEEHILTVDTALKRLDDYDIVFKDANKPLLRPEEHKCLITCQADILLKCRKNDLISVAGSRGKTTVACMLKAMLKERCLYLKDRPPFEYMDADKGEEILAVEIPDNQLLYIGNNATISIVMNCFEETIGLYKDKKDYFEAFKNLYKYQVKDDNLICNLDFWQRKFPGYLSVIGTRRLPFRDLGKTDCHIFGLHNMFNVSILYEIAEILDIPSTQFISFLRDFMPLPGHEEFITAAMLVNFYDDSYSRYVNDTVCALRSIPNMDTVIIGGDEDKSPLNLVEELYKNKVRNLILYGTFGREVYRLTEGNKRRMNVYFCDSPEECFKKAADVCERTKSVCLSPGCKSDPSLSKKYREFIAKL